MPKESLFKPGDVRGSVTVDVLWSNTLASCIYCWDSAATSASSRASYRIGESLVCEKHALERIRGAVASGSGR
jgi:hypothetical protein